MAEYIDKTVALSIHEPPKSNRYYQTNNLDDAYEQGWDEALSYIEKNSRCQRCPDAVRKVGRQSLHSMRNDADGR